MLTKRIPKYLIISFGVFAASILLLYSNFIIYSLEFYKPRPAYWDLTNGINPLWDCFKHSGLKLFSIDNNTFPSLEGCRNFNYGYFSVVSFGLLHVLSNNQNFWGVLQVLIFSILVSKTYLDSGKIDKKLFFALLALMSPGIFLLEASGNMDIQVVCLVLGALILFRRGNFKTGLFFICISALFKFYTSPLVLIFTLITQKRKDRALGFGMTIITGLLIVFQMIWTPIPPFPGGAQNKFGAMIIGNYMRKSGININDMQGHIIGILLVVLLTSILFLLKNSKSELVKNHSSADREKEDNEFRHFYFLVLSLTSIVCYFATLSVDYRLVFVALAGISLTKIEQKNIKFASKLFPYTFFLSLWVVFPFAYLSKYIGIDLQPVGDVALLGTISYFIVQAIYSFQFLMNSKFMTFKFNLD